MVKGGENTSMIDLQGWAKVREIVGVSSEGKH